MGLSLAKQSMPPQKMLVINNIHYFNFLVYCLVIIIEMGHDLGSNNIQKNGEREVLQNYQDDNGKGLRKETIYFDF